MVTVPPDIFRRRNGRLSRSFWYAAAILLAGVALAAMAVLRG